MFSRFLCYGLGIVISIFLVIKGELTIGQFGGCILAFSMLQDEVETLVRVITGIENKLPFVEDYYTFLDKTVIKKIYAKETQFRQVFRVLKQTISVFHFQTPQTVP